MKSVYARAGDLLAKSGARLLLIEALLILLLLIPVYTTFVGASSLLLSAFGDSLWGAIAISVGFTVLELLFSFFVAVPLVEGVFYMAHRAAMCKALVLVDLFYAFSSCSHYREALKHGRPLFVGGALLYLAFFAIDFILYVYLPGCETLGYLCMLVVLLSGYLLLPLSFVSLRQKYGRAEGALRGLRLRLGFLPWILLGILTFGILLLADVLPRLLVASQECMDSNDIKEDGTTPSLSDK